MDFFEPYLSSVWMYSFETFLSNSGDAIERSMRKTFAEVPLCQSGGIMIRVPPVCSIYQTIILHYQDYGNRCAFDNVFLAKVFIHST